MDEAQPSTRCSGHLRVVSSWRCGLDTLRISEVYFETYFDAEGFTVKREFNVALQEVNGIFKFPNFTITSFATLQVAVSPPPPTPFDVS